MQQNNKFQVFHNGFRQEYTHYNNYASTIWTMKGNLYSIFLTKLMQQVVHFIRKSSIVLTKSYCLCTLTVGCRKANTLSPRLDLQLMPLLIQSRLKLHESQIKIFRIVYYTQQWQTQNLQSSKKQAKHSNYKQLPSNVLVLYDHYSCPCSAM